MTASILATGKSAKVILGVLFGALIVIGLFCCFRAGVRLVRAENTPREDAEKTRFRVTVIVFITVLVLVVIAMLVMHGWKGAQTDSGGNAYEQAAIRRRLP